MTIDQIRMSWKKSQMNPDSPSSTHSQYPDEMCRKTVLNRALKIHINSSSDDHLFLDEFNRTGDDAAELAFEEEIEENANSEYLDIEDAPDEYDDRTIDLDTGEVLDEELQEQEPLLEAVGAGGGQPKRGPNF
jgi:recombination protein RecT